MSARPYGYKTLDLFLDAAVKELIIPILYFDTNVYLDIVDDREPKSLKLYQYISQDDWQCVTSIFARVETLEVKQFHAFKDEKKKVGWSTKRIEKERHKRDLSPKVLGNISRSVTIRTKLKCKGFKIYSCLLEDGWELAEDIKRKTNLTDKDSIHLAEAMAIACDLFVSRDESLIDVAKKFIWAETPDTLIEILKSVNANI